MLSAIYLKGFKTFARPVRMPLSGGVTAIVGPNGSGKSNITDAVLFALGEGSPSVLRAGSMEDLIFSGSESLPTANAAEVTLVLDNADGNLSLPYREVSLTRRISRGGETEYRINGARSRLADVRAVAGEAGVGRHSILRQGAVDAIVAGGAGACRVALEEAAGLGVFRRRRQSAARKLEHAAAQLESSRRLEAEISEQLRRIEAEAAAAREYRELEARYRRLSLAYLYRMATRGLDDLRARLAATEARVAGLASREGALQEEEARLGAAEREIEVRIWASERRIEGLERALELLQAATLRAERALFRLEGGRDRAEDRQRLVSRLEAELERLSVETRRMEDGIAGLEESHSGAKRELGRLEEAVLQCRKAHTTAAMRRARAVGNLDALRARRERAAARLGGAEPFEEEDLRRIGIVGGRLTPEPFEELGGRAADLLGRVKELRVFVRERLEEADRRRGILAALVGRAEAEVRGLRAPDRGGSGRRLYEVIRARPGYEAAVEAALGDLAGGVLAEDLDEVMRFLAGPYPAERVVVRLDAEGVPENGSPPGKPLVECVEVLDASYAGAVARLLGGIHVVEGTPPPEASPKNGHVAVTREGLRLTRTSATRRVSDGDLVREARLADEEARLHALKGRVGDQLYDLRESLDVVSARLDGLALGARRLDAMTARAHRAARLLAQEAGWRTKKAERTRDLRAAGEAELHETEEKISAAERLLREAAEAEEHASKEIAAVAPGVETAYAAAQEAASKLSRSRTGLAERRERASRISRELARLEGVFSDGGSARLTESAHRAVEISGRFEEAARERLSAVRHTRSEIAERRSLLAGERAKFAREAADLAAGLARDRAEAEALRGGLARAEEAASAAAREISEEWGATLEAARAEAEALPETSDAERGRLARKLKGFGDVNLLAISQEGSLRERHDFVAAQRADAEAAAVELERLIRGVDAEIEARFAATFGEARRAFGALVPRMMQGAAGELSLSEEGVEIGLRLRRRGWRPLRVLSGGERSLLALSFLFSVFLGRPESGPGAFCVLDEAEAALDDINLARFLAVVDSHRADGQFLLVTHQKRTMAAADVLYGVTPDASGATIVVSKRLTGE